MTDRRARILELLQPSGRGELGSSRLGRVCAEVTGSDGAGIMLIAEDGPRGSVVATDAISALIEDVQFAVGEGPCIDAHALSRPALEPDLASPAVVRWMAFSPPVLEAGARAVFSFPLRLGEVRLGSMDVYRLQAGELSSDEHADALVMASVAAQALLLMQAGALPNTLATALEVNANYQFVVHQASGMVAAQLDVGVRQALIRLRGHAFGSGRSLSTVAQDVVDRRLRFEPDDDAPGGTS